MKTETESQTAVEELWSRVVQDPRFDDLPYKVETNECGQLILSPHKLRHSNQQSRLLDLLRDHQTQPGRRSVEFAINTRKGTKVADVVWISDDRWATIPGDAEASPVAPDIVIEVLSRSNSHSEMAAKRDLYFSEGAIEMWTCGPEGQMRFYDPEGELPTSQMVPSFPMSTE